MLVAARFYLFGWCSVLRDIYTHDNMAPYFPCSGRNFGETTQLEESLDDCSLISLDLKEFLSEVPQESPLQFEESAPPHTIRDLSVVSSDTASSSDSDREKEGPSDAYYMKRIGVTGGITVAIMFLAGPIMKLFKKCFNQSDDTPVPDAGAPNEVLKAPARSPLNRRGEVAQEGAHQSSSQSIKGALALQKDLS
jgi:hypothetical protein